MAVHLIDKQRVILFDFGLARRFVEYEPGSTTRLRVRPKREHAPFRGTFHYASVSQHQYRETVRKRAARLASAATRRQLQGRVDDLWALMYTLIDFIAGL